MPNSFYTGASEIPVETKSDCVFTPQDGHEEEEEEGMTIISLSRNKFLQLLTVHPDLPQKLIPTRLSAVSFAIDLDGLSGHG